MSIGNIFRFLMLPSLRKRWLRAILITLGISIGIALYIAITVINSSTLKSFESSVMAMAGKTQLTVTAGEIGFPEDKIETVSATPGVAHAVPLVMNRGYFAGAGARTTLQIMGVDLLKEQSVRTYKTKDEEVIDDPLVFLNQPDSIILTKDFAKANGLDLDSVITLATIHGSQKFTVRGLLSPEGPAKAFGGSLAIMDIDGARMMFGKENKLDRIDVVAKEGEDLTALQERLQASLGPSYTVDKPESQSEDLKRMVSSFQAMLGLFSTLALLISVFMVFNLVSISVTERRREIGMLRALGAARPQVLFLFISESLFFGVIGSSLGSLLGWLLSFQLVGQITRTLSSQFIIQVDVPQIVFTQQDFLRGFGIGTVSALLASLWPSIQATRIQPVEAFVARGVETATGRMRSFYIPFGAFGFFLLTMAANILLKDKAPPFVHTMFLACGFLGAVIAVPSAALSLVSGVNTLLLRGMKGQIEWKLALGNICSQRRRTVSNISALLIGLSFVVLISTIESSFKNTASNWISRALTMDVIVASQGRLIQFNTQALEESVAAEVSRLPEVRQAAHGISYYSTRFLRLRYQGKQIAMKAIDPPEEHHWEDFIIHDRPSDEALRDLFAMTDPPAVFVSDNFVGNFHKKTGDRITLPTPAGEQEFRIAGINTDLSNPQGVIYMDRSVYKKFWHDSVVNAFGLYAAEGVSSQQLKSAIENRFGPEKNLLVQLNSEVRKQMGESIDQSFAFVGAIEFAALIVTLFGILNTVMVSVLERTREFALLRAVGTTRLQLFQMILREVLLQGAIGAVAAIALGTVLSFIWVQNSLSQVLGWKVNFYFPWNNVGYALLLGIVVAVLAGIGPAWKATRLTISEALSYE